MRILIQTAVIFSILVIGLPAFAATVQRTDGEVFIDRGSGYTQVPGAVQGNPGDTVMAMAGGRAEIIYNDGCRQAVEVGSVVTISETSPCALAQNGSNTVAAGTDYTLVVGGVAVAAGVGAAIALGGGGSSKKKKDKSASP